MNSNRINFMCYDILSLRGEQKAYSEHSSTEDRLAWTLCQLPLLAGRVQVDGQVTAGNLHEADEHSCHVVQFRLKPLSTFTGKTLLTLEFLLRALNKGPKTYKTRPLPAFGSAKDKMSNPSAMQSIFVDSHGRLCYGAQLGVPDPALAPRPYFRHPVDPSAPLGSFENPYPCSGNPVLPSSSRGNERTARNQVAKGLSSNSKPKHPNTTEKVLMQQQPPSGIQQPAWNGPLPGTQSAYVPPVPVRRQMASPSEIQVNWGPRSDSPRPHQSVSLSPALVQQPARRVRFVDATATSRPHQEIHSPSSLSSYMPRSQRVHRHLAPSPPQSPRPSSPGSTIISGPESDESACTICDDMTVTTRDGPVRYCGPCLEEAESAEDQHNTKETQRRSLIENEVREARRRDTDTREAQMQATERIQAQREAEIETRRRSIERGVRTVRVERVLEERPLMRGAVDRQMRDFEMERRASQRRMGPNGVIYRDV